MRLLYVCSDFGIPPAGTKGASIHLRSITRALIDLRHDVRLLSPKGAPGGDHPVRSLVNDGCPPAEQTAKLLKRWLTDRGFDDGVARELRPLIYNAWVHERLADVLGDFTPDAIIERLSLFGHVGLDLADALNVPLIVEVNAPLTEEASRYRSLELSGLAGEIERRVLVQADAVTAVSRPLADWLTANGVSDDNVHVIPNGVNLDLFQKRAPLDDARAALGFDDAFVVGFAGSLKRWHGVDVLLQAFIRLHGEDASVRLLIVGTGPCESELRAAVAEAGIDGAVIFTGAVPHDRVPSLLSAVDVAVAPFRRAENFYFSPIKLFEYMACGNCVVASRLGQLAEIIEDGVNGWLCEPDDEQELCRVLRRAKDQPTERVRLAEAGRETVRSRFTWERAARETMRVVEQAMERRAQRPEGGRGRAGERTTVTRG